MPSKTRYRALNGLSYPPERRAEPGDIVDDLPAKSIPWLLEQGHIELAPEVPPVAPDAPPSNE